MERLFKIRIFTVMFFLAVASIAANAKESKKEGDNYHAKQILIVGLHDNVKSNYFYNGMIAEETGMKADSIDQTYNTIIAENIAASVKNGDCKFIPANATQVTGQVLNEIKVNGESEDCYSDLSAVFFGDMLLPACDDFFTMILPVFPKNIHGLIHGKGKMQVCNGKKCHFLPSFLISDKPPPAHSVFR